jgi:hypothetical protein
MTGKFSLQKKKMMTGTFLLPKETYDLQVCTAEKT